MIILPLSLVWEPDDILYAKFSKYQNSNVWKCYIFLLFFKKKTIGKVADKMKKSKVPNKPSIANPAVDISVGAIILLDIQTAIDNNNERIKINSTFF